MPLNTDKVMYLSVYVVQVGVYHLVALKDHDNRSVRHLGGYLARYQVTGKVPFNNLSLLTFS